MRDCNVRVYVCGYAGLQSKCMLLSTLQNYKFLVASTALPLTYDSAV